MEKGGRGSESEWSDMKNFQLAIGVFEDGGRSHVPRNSGSQPLEVVKGKDINFPLERKKAKEKED